MNSDKTGSTETLETPKEDSQPASAQSAAPGAAPRQTIKVDDTQVIACYANFCQISSTPEELVLDLGLNPHPMTPGEITVKVSQRIILNHYTAKRLLAALSASLHRHEQAFGVLETDVRRRVRSN